MVNTSGERRPACTTCVQECTENEIRGSLDLLKLVLCNILKRHKALLCSSTATVMTEWMMDVRSVMMDVVPKNGPALVIATGVLVPMIVSSVRRMCMVSCISIYMHVC